MEEWSGRVFVFKEVPWFQVDVGSLSAVTVKVSSVSRADPHLPLPDFPRRETDETFYSHKFSLIRKK